MVAARQDEGAKLLQVSKSEGGAPETMSTDDSSKTTAKIFKPTSALKKKGRRWCDAPVNENPEKRRITFYPGVSVRECLHINDFTDEEVFNAWYKRSDFSRIKQTFQIIVQKLASGTYTGDTDHETCRGLEYRHREGAMKRKANKLNGLMAVLDEQERQWTRGYDDDVAISDAIVAVSLKCSFSARMVAAKDEAEVRAMWPTPVEDEITEKVRDISIDGSSGKRSLSPAEDDERAKKTRLKRFMKKIQTAQRVAGALSSAAKNAPQEPRTS